jgi:peptidoglycan/LPS O-acetylase OafA/YrhL
LILFVIAWISYHFFEIHFIYLKRKISIVKQPPE